MLAGLITASPSAQSADERAAARDLVKRRGDAVVMVLATIKVRVNIDGREQPTDQAAQTNATVLDGTGLAVLSLSALQPDDVMQRSISQRVAPGTRVEVSSAPADIRMHLADGRELPAKLVLKDEDLDLAFVRPTDVPAAPMIFVDAPVGKPSILDPILILQRTSEATAWTTGASFASVQLVIDKPRTYYLLTVGASLGAPLFDTSGRFVGVTVMRNAGARGSTPLSGVLPADEIKEVAKQAPAIK